MNEQQDMLATLVILLMMVAMGVYVGIGMEIKLPWEENPWKAGVLFVLKWGALFLLWAFTFYLLDKAIMGT